MSSSCDIDDRERNLKFGLERLGPEHLALLISYWAGGKMVPQSHSVLSEHNVHSMLIAFYSLHFLLMHPEYAVFLL